MANVSFADLCPPSVVAVRYFAGNRPLSRMLFMVSQVLELMFPESSAPVVTEVICPKDLSKVDITNYRLRVQFDFKYVDSVISWVSFQSHVNYVSFDFCSSSVVLGFSFVRVRYFDTFFCIDSLGLQKRYKFSESDKWPDFSVVKRLTGQLSDKLPGLFNF